MKKNLLRSNGKRKKWRKKKGWLVRNAKKLPQREKVKRRADAASKTQQALEIEEEAKAKAAKIIIEGKMKASVLREEASDECRIADVLSQDY